jgi:hypothetical protein
LACGALSVSATRFFTMFAGLRLVRFSILTALAWFYGRQILAMFQTGTFKTLMGVVVVLIVVGTSTTIYRLVTMTSTRQHLAASDRNQLHLIRSASRLPNHPALSPLRPLNARIGAASCSHSRLRTHARARLLSWAFVAKRFRRAILVRTSSGRRESRSTTSCLIRN